MFVRVLCTSWWSFRTRDWCPCRPVWQFSQPRSPCCPSCWAQYSWTQQGEWQRPDLECAWRGLSVVWPSSRERSWSCSGGPDLRTIWMCLKSCAAMFIIIFTSSFTHPTNRIGFSALWPCSAHLAPIPGHVRLRAAIPDLLLRPLGTLSDSLLRTYSICPWAYAW